MNNQIGVLKRKIKSAIFNYTIQSGWPAHHVGGRADWLRNLQQSDISRFAQGARKSQSYGQSRARSQSVSIVGENSIIACIASFRLRLWRPDTRRNLQIGEC